MSVALVFTLSRGAIVSLLLTVLILLLVLYSLGRVRWSLMVLGALLVAVLGYGAWIGLEPLLARVRHADYAARFIQGLTTLPMLRAFPLLGVGLGAYGDIYPRYQPLALTPGKVSYPYAHDDLLQLAVELGALGALLIGWMGWRVGRDLLGAHLLGRAACPVGGGEREGAQRHDPFSVGLGVGAVGAVLALLVHSAFDFAARIPANGILAAACLGIATVALHTRFQATGERLLTASPSVSLAGRSGRAVALGVGGDRRLAGGRAMDRPPPTGGGPAPGGRARGHGSRHRAAMGPGRAGPGPSRRACPGSPRPPEARRHGGALEFRRGPGRAGPDHAGRAATGRPGPPGRCEAGLRGLPSRRSRPTPGSTTAAPVPSGRRRCSIPPNAAPHLESALASFSRAAALAPENPFPYWTLAVFAAPQGGRYTEIGLRAARMPSSEIRSCWAISSTSFSRSGSAERSGWRWCPHRRSTGPSSARGWKSGG